MSFSKRRKFVYIDSGKRLTGTSSDFSYSLDLSEGDRFDHCVITQASIPFTYYLIRDGFNTFQLKETGQTAVTITIPVGNYNINSFVEIVGPLLTTAGVLGSTYTLTYPKSFTQSNTAFITTTITGGTSSDAQYIFNSSNTISEQFGFESGSTNTFDGLTLSSSNTVNFLTNRSLLIHSNIVDGGSSNILQEIYSNNSQINGNIIYQSTDALVYAKKLKLSNQNVINIYLSDINGVKIDLNGVDMNITLMLYEANKFTDIVEGFIKHLLQKELRQQSVIQGTLPTDIAPTGIAPTGIAPTDIAPTDIIPTDIDPLMDEQGIIQKLDIDGIQITKISLDGNSRPFI